MQDPPKIAQLEALNRPESLDEDKKEEVRRENEDRKLKFKRMCERHTVKKPALYGRRFSMPEIDLNPYIDSISTQQFQSNNIQKQRRPRAFSNFARDINLDYCLKRDNVVGEGAFSTVYEGTNRKTNETVVIKQIRKDYLCTVNDINCINREIQIHSTISHPNIVPLLTYYDDDNNFFLVMPKADAGTIESYLQSRGVLTEQESKWFTYQILNALNYLHSFKIVHGDIKPSNILLFKDKEYITAPPEKQYKHLNAMLADFGLSICSSCITDSSSVRCKSVTGSSGYIAPEMLEYHFISTKNDVWATGILLFHMLFGFDPFYPYSTCLTEDVLIEERDRVNISDQAVHIVKKMLIRDRCERPSVSELLSDPWFQECIFQI